MPQGFTVQVRFTLTNFKIMITLQIKFRYKKDTNQKKWKKLITAELCEFDQVENTSRTHKEKLRTDYPQIENKKITIKNHGL